MTSKKQAPEIIFTKKTDHFIKAVELLKAKGVIQFYKEIYEALKWSKSSMSQVLSRSMNVPDYVYAEFIKKWGDYLEGTPLLNNSDTKEGKQEPNGDYKDKYIALLEKQLEQRESQIATRKDYFDKLEEVNANYVKMADSLQKMRKELTEVHALARTLYVFFQHTYSHQLKQPREKVSQDMDIVFGQVLQQQHELDSQPA